MLRLIRRPRKKIKIVLSDLHIGSGLFVDGKKNPHEDFYFDQELIDLLSFFSSGDYGDHCEVEVIFNGDVIDFLAIPVAGDFPDAIDEAVAVNKLEQVFAGHPELTLAMQDFVAKPKKYITYNIGNHDPEFFFPKVRELFCRTLLEKQKDSSRVRVNHEQDHIDCGGGVQLHHGNQFEAVHVMNYTNPFIRENVQSPILDLPWGSLYVLKIINRLKWERDYVDKVKPAKYFLFVGMILDPIFTLRFIFLSVFYFFHTRFIYNPKRRATIRNTLKIIKQEFTPFHGLEPAARRVLDDNPKIHTVIFGHTHGPLQMNFKDGKTYINTGTWCRMINLDLQHLGQDVRLTFAFIDFDDNGVANASLQEWQGTHAPFKLFQG